MTAPGDNTGGGIFRQAGDLAPSSLGRKYPWGAGLKTPQKAMIFSMLLSVFKKPEPEDDRPPYRPLRRLTKGKLIKPGQNRAIKDPDKEREAEQER